MEGRECKWMMCDGRWDLGGDRRWGSGWWLPIGEVIEGSQKLQLTALEMYFNRHKSGTRFYVSSKWQFMSSTVKLIFNLPSKILF